MAYRYRVKIVPLSDPNADGRYIDIETHKMIDRVDDWKMIKELIPEDHFIVRLEVVR